MDHAISILGHGFVGSSISALLNRNNYNDFNVYDISPKEGFFNFYNNLDTLIKNVESKYDTHYIIICVPTPSDSYGNCDTSIIKTLLKQLNQLITKDTYICIKSTVVPGTMTTFYNLFPNLNLIFLPEFLREVTANEDMYNAQFVLIGIPPEFTMTKYQNLLHFSRTLYSHNKDIEIIIRSYEECELFKYTLNTYFGLKITFFNEIHELCDSMHVDYQKLKSLFRLDPRIGSYGTTVPGPNNHFFGYFLSCLPKEVKGMAQLQEKMGLSSELIKCVDERNTYFNKKPVTKESF